jgi:flavin-dependent dehydrogenase
VTRPEGDCDLLVIGGGPAGLASAAAACDRKLRTLILERADQPQPGNCTGWLGPAAVRFCKDRGVKAKDAGATEFAGLRLRSWDLEHCVDVHDPELTGWIVDPPQLTKALSKAVEAAGVELHPGNESLDLELGERNATVRLKGESEVSGAVVLIADGAASPTTSRLQLPPVSRGSQTGGCAFASASGDGLGHGVDVVIAGGRALKIATIVRNETRLRVGLLTRDTESSPVSQLDSFLADARAAGQLPDVTLTAEPVADLSGVALEVESHVSKRCLLVGDAGGFVASFSNEGIYPALRSGWLAGETVARALEAPVLQDELATFGSIWRADLADYLRMPNTDLGLLMPMVFNNPQMSRRVARAFLLGQAF